MLSRLMITIPMLLLLTVQTQAVSGAENEQMMWLKSPAVFRDAMSRVLPSLVSIEAFGAGQAAKTTKKGGGAISGLGRIGTGPSTAVVYSVYEGRTYLVTSTFQFLTNPALITVTFDEDDRRVGKIHGKDATRKLCVVSVETKPEDEQKVARFVHEDSKVGQYAISVGLGYGADEPAMSVGIISGLNRMFGKAIQTDANISPANYGGPLIDLDGQVMGICVPYSPFGKQPFAGVEWYDSGIGFAVSIESDSPLIKRLMDGESLSPGILGVVIKPAEAGDPKGVRIDKVAPKSGADKAGLEKDDMIFMVGKTKIANMRQLKLTLGRYVAGETVKVYYRRGDKIGEAKVLLMPGDTISYQKEAPDMIKRLLPKNQKQK